MAVLEINPIMREVDRRGKYITPIRVYRIADGSLAEQPDSSGKSHLAYSKNKVVTDAVDQKAIMELVNPTKKEAVSAPENKDAGTAPSNKAAKKTTRRRKRSPKK